MMDRQKFLEWKANPLTVEFLKYLKDNQTALMTAWGRGENLTPEHQCKAALMGELSSLEWADYATFYDIEEDSTP